MPVARPDSHLLSLLFYSELFAIFRKQLQIVALASTNKEMKKLWCILWLFLVLICWECASDRKRHRVVILEKTETTVAIHSGGSLKVKIPLQSGTGYDWTLDKGQSHIEEISSSVEKTDGRKVGGGTMKIFNLHTTKAMGEDLLKFNLARSFEKGAPSETRSLNVIIQP
jgi:predicted secreted protein